MEATLEKMYQAKVQYFERPVLAHMPYPYTLVKVTSPADFVVSIEDDVTKDHKVQLRKSLEEYTANFEKEKWTIDKTLIYEKMPLVINDTDGEDPWSFTRGEVVKWEKKENLVVILLVDRGGLKKMRPDQLLGVPLDLVRIPKLAMPCSMTYLRPASARGSTWGQKDYASKFTGKGSQTITFLDLVDMERMVYDAIVEVDQVNVAVRFLHMEIADPVELPLLPAEGLVPSYPVSDFSPWVGMKQIVFGVKVFVDDVDDGTELIKCVLQMDPDMVNQCQSKITKFTENLSEEEAKNMSASLKKINGSACLAPWEDEYCRATILTRTRTSQYLVRYVDYGEEQIVDGSKLLPLPTDLLNIPEGATFCIMTELIGSDFKNVDKLKELVESKDLYAIIEGCDVAQFGRELLVSLYKPIDHTGPDCSFLNILGISRKAQVEIRVLQPCELVSSSWAKLFVVPSPQLPVLKEKYTGVILVNDQSQIFLQLEEMAEKIALISEELKRFYTIGRGCSPSDPASRTFLAGSKKGKLVVAISSISEDLRRGVVIDEEGDRVTIRFIDLGNSESVQVKDVLPLHNYFVKDQPCAVHIKVVV